MWWDARQTHMSDRSGSCQLAKVGSWAWRSQKLAARVAAGAIGALATGYPRMIPPREIERLIAKGMARV